MISKTDDLTNYSFGKILGSGGYGEVREAVNTVTGKLVAIKKIQFLKDNLVDTLRLLREISILRRLNIFHEVKRYALIVRLEQVVFEGDYLSLVFEHFKTDLEKVIRSRCLTPENRQYILYQILLGVSALHSEGVVHRDLKPANILMDFDCHIRICDFGLSRAIQYTRDETQVNSLDAVLTAMPTDNAKSMVLDKNLIEQGTLPDQLISNQSVESNHSFDNFTTYVITRYYRSPETILQHSQSGGTASDVWSIGCIWAELWLFSPIFKAESALHVLLVIFDLIGIPRLEDIVWLDNQYWREQLAIYIRHEKPRGPSDFKKVFKTADDNTRDLLSKMFVFNPNERITVKDALNHPFVSRYFKPEDLAPIDNIQPSEKDKASWQDYIAFESKLNQYPDKNQANNENKEYNAEALQLIEKESKRYAPEPSSVISIAKTVSSSDLVPVATTGYSFFHHPATCPPSEKQDNLKSETKPQDADKLDNSTQDVVESAASPNMQAA